MTGIHPRLWALLRQGAYIGKAPPPAEVEARIDRLPPRDEPETKRKQKDARAAVRDVMLDRVVIQHRGARKGLA